MKSDLEYLTLAFDEWCKSAGQSKFMPLTAANCREVLVIAAKLRKADADKLEQAGA
jgi:hypothetical protein